MVNQNPNVPQPQPHPQGGPLSGLLSLVMGQLTPGQMQLVAAIGPFLGLWAGYLAAWWGIDQASASGIILFGIVGALALYNLWMTRRSAVVTQVANMPEVSNIVLDKDNPQAKGLEAATPANVVKQ